MRDKIDNSVLIALHTIDIDRIVGERCRVTCLNNIENKWKLFSGGGYLAFLLYEVSGFIGVPVAQLLNRPHRCRLRPATDGRAMLCFYLGVEKQQLGVKSLGALLNMERSSVCNAIGRHRDLYEADEAYRGKYDGMVKKLELPF